MSSHGRWKGVKIVGPLDPNREKELIGGIKNALERGENIEKAKQSFISAGYKPEEVAAAAQKVPSRAAPPTPVTTTIKKLGEKILPKPLSPKNKITPSHKKKSKIILIIIIILSILVLIGAALLGIFWNSWFGS